MGNVTRYVSSTYDGINTKRHLQPRLLKATPSTAPQGAVKKRVFILYVLILGMSLDNFPLETRPGPRPNKFRVQWAETEETFSYPTADNTNVHLKNSLETYCPFSVNCTRSYLYYCCHVVIVKFQCRCEQCPEKARLKISPCINIEFSAQILYRNL